MNLLLRGDSPKIWLPPAGERDVRVLIEHRHQLVEVPVGFKWFVEGLLDGSLGFGGEESAGASFLRRDGTVWTTDKDGMIMGLLAAEMTAVTGRATPANFMPN